MRYAGMVGLVLLVSVAGCSAEATPEVHDWTPGASGMVEWQIWTADDRISAPMLNIAKREELRINAYCVTRADKVVVGLSHSFRTSTDVRGFDGIGIDEKHRLGDATFRIGESEFASGPVEVTRLGTQFTIDFPTTDLTTFLDAIDKVSEKDQIVVGLAGDYGAMAWFPVSNLRLLSSRFETACRR